MFDSNANNNYGGMYYAPQNGPAQTKQPSVLTKEEYERLIKNDNAFSLTLTEDEYLKGICNHRTLDGSADTLVQEDDGTFRCTTCGWEFDPINTNTDDADIRESVNMVIDILQTIKLLYIDMPVQTQREYFQIIPLLSKIPELFKLAVNDFAKYENYSGWNYRNGNMNTMNLFNMLTSGMSQGYYGQPQPQQYYGQPGPQPYYGQPQPQQPYAQQQTVNPNQPLGSVPPMSNGFGYYGQPQPQQPGGYQPQMQNYAYTPQAAPEQPGVQNPAETTSETDGATVNTSATFKA